MSDKLWIDDHPIVNWVCIISLCVIMIPLLAVLANDLGLI